MYKVANAIGEGVLTADNSSDMEQSPVNMEEIDKYLQASDRVTSLCVAGRQDLLWQ
jgi:hypothetical protein